MAEKQPKTGKEFVELAYKSDKVSKIRQGKGSHTIVEFTNGTSVTVPIHGNRQLGKGILHKITKIFKEAGVLVLIFALLGITWFALNNLGLR
ncbi:MAG TPA: type II toxin-antitoxin system HicA family toxin [Anaerolineae bacterium]|nr:type II toxin-antitoxin system HicA family toxin [Anaerolineae bacterium]